MAELVLERWTYCPTGNPADERVFEIVLVDDDPRPRSNRTARITTVQRIFSRGDRSVLRGARRDVVVTTGAGSERTVEAVARLDTAHIDLDVSTSNWQLDLGGTERKRRLIGFDYVGMPAKETPPVKGERLDTVKGRR